MECTGSDSVWKSNDNQNSGLISAYLFSINLVVPAGIEDTVKTKCFKFLWKNKKDKIKRSGLYQDTSKGGLCMTDIWLMFKSLNLAWIPRLLAPGKRSWCTVPNHFFRKMGGLNLYWGATMMRSISTNYPFFIKMNWKLSVAMTNHQI